MRAPDATPGATASRRGAAVALARKKVKKASLKNQLRSVERLLAKVTDSKARAALRSSQATLLRAQADAARVVREKKLSVRYHKVKFFERKRVVKAQEKLRKEVEAQGWANAEQRARLKQLDEDAEYVQSFPKGEKYVALFAQGGDEAHAVAERTRLRALIKANLAAAAVLAEADEGGAELELGAGEDEDEGEDEFFLGEGGQGGAAWGEDAFFQSPHQPTAPPVPAPPLCFADALTRRGSKQPTKAAPKDAGGRAAPPRVRPGGGGGGGGDAAPSQGAGKRGRPAAEDFAWKKQKRPASASVAPTHPGAAAPTAAAARRVHVRFDGGEAPQAAPPARAPPPPAAAAAPLRPPAKAKAEAKAPLRSRAEGGRKRRSKK